VPQKLPGLWQRVAGKYRGLISYLKRIFSTFLHSVNREWAVNALLVAWKSWYIRNQDIDATETRDAFLV